MLRSKHNWLNIRRFMYLLLMTKCFQCLPSDAESYLMTVSTKVGSLDSPCQYCLPWAFLCSCGCDTYTYCWQYCAYP